MSSKTVSAFLASALPIAAWAALAGFAVCTEAQSGPRAWTQRTSWGDLDLQGEWTSEGEYGVPLERPAPSAHARSSPTRSMRSASPTSRHAINATRPSTCSQARSTGRTRRFRTGANTKRTRGALRSSSIRRTDDCRRELQAQPLPVERCGSLQRGEPCDSYKDYGLGVRCIVHGGGFPDAMFPAVYNANFRSCRPRVSSRSPTS